MKKKHLLILALCWVVGIGGGYYIGVESASIPSEQIDFNYFSDKPGHSIVQPVDSKDEAENEENDDSYLNRLLRESKLYNLPKRLFEKALSPSACQEIEPTDKQPRSDSLA